MLFRSPVVQATPPSLPDQTLKDETLLALSNAHLLDINRQSSPELTTLLGTPSVHTATRSRGMRNLGNTCYGNALLAALSRLPRLRGWLSQHTSDFASGIQHHRLHCAICRLAPEFQGITDINDRTRLLPETMRHVALWNRHFANRRQHDAEEAFETLFAACDKCTHMQLRVQMNTPPNEDLPQHVLDATPYYKIFGCVFRYTIHCTACSTSSSNLEAFTTLQLDLLSGVKTLDHLVASRFAPAPCDSDYICSNTNCTARGTHSQSCNIVRWPQVLVVHLKRWSFDALTQAHTKIEQFVQFPATHRPNPDTTYNLRSIVVHQGQANGGHYVAYTRDELHGWLYYNDADTPAATPLSVVLQQRPYMLFYERE